MNVQQGFPTISAPFVDLKTGQLTQTWYQLLIALWNRTGQGSGATIDDPLTVAIQADSVTNDLSQISDIAYSQIMGSNTQNYQDADQSTLLALSLTNDTAQTIALTGDVTGAGTGSFATTIAKIQGVTVSGTTGTGNVVFSNNSVLVAPALGTPVSGVATNLTGTAGGLTAGTVTTNANLTGPIGSTGNVTFITSQTGTGTKFVVDTSPTIKTPTFDSATVTSNITNALNIGGGAAYGMVALSCDGSATFGLGLNNSNTGSLGEVSVNILRNGSSVGSITTTNTATSFNTSSDARLKENVKPITNSGEILDALNPCEFDFILQQIHAYGFIAQEVYNVLPDAVTPGDDDATATAEQVSLTSQIPQVGTHTMWQMDRSMLIPHAIAEIKSLRQRMAVLEGKSTS
jgi:endosialidase-like protein